MRIKSIGDVLGRLYQNYNPGQKCTPCEAWKKSLSWPNAEWKQENQSENNNKHKELFSFAYSHIHTLTRGSMWVAMWKSNGNAIECREPELKMKRKWEHKTFTRKQILTHAPVCLVCCVAGIALI